MERVLAWNLAYFCRVRAALGAGADTGFRPDVGLKNLYLARTYELWMIYYDWLYWKNILQGRQKPFFWNWTRISEKSVKQNREYKNGTVTPIVQVKTFATYPVPVDWETAEKLWSFERRHRRNCRSIALAGGLRLTEQWSVVVVGLGRRLPRKDIKEVTVLCLRDREWGASCHFSLPSNEIVNKTMKKNKTYSPGKA